MARSLSQTLITRLLSARPPLPARLVQSRGARSSSYVPEKPQNRVQQLELEDKTAEAERVTVQKVEEAVHGIVARRVQPLWMPLVPGGSYWVPPASKEKGFVDVIERLAGQSSSSVSSSKVAEAPAGGNRSYWPCSEYFFRGE